MKKTGNPWFAWRDTPAEGQTQPTPNVLLPLLDVSNVKIGVLNRIGNTRRLRVPGHLFLIKDLVTNAHTRIIPKGCGGGRRHVIALDQEAVTMLRRAGAVLLKDSHRHELTGLIMAKAS